MGDPAVIRVGRAALSQGPLVLMTIAMVVAGCIAGPVGSGIPSRSSGPSPTLNPNQLDRLGRTPAPPPTVQPTASPPSAASSPTSRPTPSPYAADLEALLPSELRGIPLQRYSLPASQIPAGGDMCSWVCPGEPQALAAALGVGLDRIDLAVAFPDEHAVGAPRVGIVAYRVRGIATDRLVPARIASMQRPSMPRIEVPLTLGGKAVTWAMYSALPSAGTMEYLYARGDVLYRVIDGVPPETGSTTPPDTVLAIRALP